MFSFRGLKGQVPTLVEGRVRGALGTAGAVSISRLAARRWESGTSPSWKNVQRPCGRRLRPPASHTSAYGYERTFSRPKLRSAYTPDSDILGEAGKV